ncbi:alpha-N-acetylglucosaminidase-like, partial [Limulus polyphemus]|uniref:Alpha-N-acetylglucosaminidase-like n=1 Tax=Limulus polyphemus TaxID=6850 RepID=A0ABM1SWU8_LIMPO
MKPPSGDLEYIKATGRAVFQSMLDADQKAIWVMQGWMFTHSQEFWTRDRSKALLTSVPLGRMIVLDLQSEFAPQYQRLESYYGQPFIWCMLHNFGGVLGLYGDMESVNKGPFTGRSFPNSTMIGTGLTPEGIEQNEVMYELMNEASWRKKPVNLKKWVSMYSYRRYGQVSMQVSKAWKLLKRSVFNCTLSLKDHGRYIIVQRPSLHNKPFMWFNPKDVFTAWKLFVSASKNKYLSQQENFRYDLVDVTREALQLLGGELYGATVDAYRRRSITDLRNISITMLDLLEDLDKVLATDKHFLLGNWIESAKSLGTDVKERKLYEYNARNQVTLWGPNGE